MEKKIDIHEFLNRDEKKDLLRFLTCGSVDDGKSTLIGRLMFDSKTLYEDQLATLERDSKRVGHAGEDIDYALLLDGLKAEREQGITIDVAYRYFGTNRRKFIIADTPGHEQYTRNMVTGASTSNLAVVLIDATKGVITQTCRHTFLVSLLGIKHVVLAVNKMDLVDYKEEVFRTICEDYKNFISQLDIPDVEFIPISALKGENVVDNSSKMPWYKGKCMLHFLESVHINSDRNFDDFRYPVQYVSRPDRDFRGFCARVVSGVVRKGDSVMVLPSKKRSTVSAIKTYDGDLDKAFPPQSVTLTLEDEIDISRGEMIVHPDNLPHIERQFEAMLVWMDEKAMNPNGEFYIKHNTNTTKARFDTIRNKVDVNTLETSEDVSYLELNEIGRVVITTVKPLFFDAYKKNKNTGSFVLIDPMTNNTCAVGMITDKIHADSLPHKITETEKSKIEQGIGLISPDEYQQRYNQKGETIWITGLHGSGKNDLAYKIEKLLFKQGATVVLLDGSSVRSGLSKELDYSPADRAENLRRVAEMCKILNDQGIITICSFISADNTVREQVSEIIGEERFNLIYMGANLEYCQAKKPDLYNLAQEKRITNLPGIDCNYDIPKNPDIMCDPEKNDTNSIEVLDYLASKGIFPVQ
ncbi:MAG: sulfate adenylyltransferase subunit CysN [Bacteroidales bacterium]